MHTGTSEGKQLTQSLCVYLDLMNMGQAQLVFSDWYFLRAGLAVLGQRADNLGRNHATVWHKLCFGT